MEHLLFLLAVLAFLLVAVSRMPGAERGPAWLNGVGTVALWVGAAAQLGGLVTMALRTQHLPVYTPGASMASLGLAVAIAALVLQRLPQGGTISGLLAALCVVLLGLGLLLPNDLVTAGASVGSLWFPIHAASIFLGLAGFALAFGVSLLYLRVRAQLKSKRLAGLERLPSLDELDGLNTRFVVAGFLALTLGIAAGGLWATAEGRTGALGPTVYATLVMWGWYAAAISVRVVGGWRGRMAALFSVVGFVGLIIGLGAIGVVFRGWH
ncbi:MAG: cytochrome c biogenesis protein CcsA [Alphaproteobacteria bacterium]|nr:cytochrome c biogenesis protein CcsA [Alphaproteobacteria bacterium]MCB9793510.1 cytochrome c biogenesis protein CcsA [Alphaproteobacteria bacterium]